MRVAFYKGKKRLFNRLVAWWTNGPYSHVELVLPDGYSYTSSFMDGGVRRKYINFAESNWDLLDIGELTQLATVEKNIYKMQGMGYDVLGLVGFVVRKVKDSKKKVFCSEFVMQALGFEDAWRFDPNTAYSVLRQYANGRK